ncbi:unnamed protein product [Amoebophrya sp. A25]|nr:unnamed protein product [Amoebophrya sp. A25]|eukprot:GSA25T00024272001.1
MPRGRAASSFSGGRPPLGKQVTSLDEVGKLEMSYVHADLWQESQFLRIIEQIEALSAEFIQLCDGNRSRLQNSIKETVTNMRTPAALELCRQNRDEEFREIAAVATAELRSLSESISEADSPDGILDIKRKCEHSLQQWQSNLAAEKQDRSERYGSIWNKIDRSFSQLKDSAKEATSLRTASNQRLTDVIDNACSTLAADLESERQNRQRGQDRMLQLFETLLGCVEAKSEDQSLMAALFNNSSTVPRPLLFAEKEEDSTSAASIPDVHVAGAGGQVEDFARNANPNARGLGGISLAPNANYPSTRSRIASAEDEDSTTRTIRGLHIGAQVPATSSGTSNLVNLIDKSLNRHESKSGDEGHQIGGHLEEGALLVRGIPVPGRTGATTSSSSKRTELNFNGISLPSSPSSRNKVVSSNYLNLGHLAAASTTTNEGSKLQQQESDQAPPPEKREDFKNAFSAFLERQKGNVVDAPASPQNKRPPPGCVDPSVADMYRSIKRKLRACQHSADFNIQVGGGEESGG